VHTPLSTISNACTLLLALTNTLLWFNPRTGSCWGRTRHPLSMYSFGKGGDHRTAWAGGRSLIVQAKPNNVQNKASEPINYYIVASLYPDRWNGVSTFLTSAEVQEPKCTMSYSLPAVIYSSPTLGGWMQKLQWCEKVRLFLATWNRMLGIHITLFFRRKWSCSRMYLDQQWEDLPIRQSVFNDIDPQPKQHLSSLNMQ